MLSAAGEIQSGEGLKLFLHHPTESDAASAEAQESQAKTTSAPSKPADLSLPTGYKDLGSVLGDLLLGQARLSDEFEKYRRQMSQEDEFARFAKQSVQFIDAMDRMVASAKTFQSQDEVGRWLHGVDSAYQKMLKLMEKFGLSVISCDGQTVDVSKHDVVEYRETTDYPHDTVIETVLKGIVLRGKILRDPRVIVACNRPPDTADTAKNGDAQA